MAPHLRRRTLALDYIRQILLAPTAIGFAVYLLTWRFNISYRPLWVVCSITAGWPITFSLGVRCGSWRRARRARALGGVAAYESRGKMFADIDVIQEIQEMDKNGFIGQFLCLPSST